MGRFSLFPIDDFGPRIKRLAHHIFRGEADMTFRFAFAAALAVLATPLTAEQAAPPPGAPLSIDLAFMGRGTMHKMRQVPDGHNKKGERKTRTQSYDEPFHGMLRVRIRGGQADALPPEPMLAQADVGGWRPIKKLSVSEAAITGKIDLGFLYAPVFKIDRYAGTISVNGSMNSFEGSCRPYDASERQF